MRGFVSFLYHGRELVDEKALSFYRIADGDVIVHNYFANTGRSDVEIDYSGMADEADQMALLGAQVEDEYDTRWVGGETVDVCLAEKDLSDNKRKITLSIKLLEELDKKEALLKFGTDGSSSGKNLPFASLQEDLKKKEEDK